MNDIKAIETVYNGYRFRSRLEARWAVFFDSLNIEYKYEPEGFDIYGEYYLPDFYLPGFDIYVEIKPFDKSVVRYVDDGNAWEKKCARFRDCTGNAILLCYDEPSAPAAKLLFAWDYSDSNAGSGEYKCAFGWSEEIGAIIVVDLNKDLCIHGTFEVANERFSTGGRDAEWRELLQEFYWGLYDPNGDDPISLAKTASRKARFEYGERNYL